MRKPSHAFWGLLSVVVAACGPSEPRLSKHAGPACDALGDPAKAAAPFYEAGNVYSARPLTRTVSRTRSFETRQIAGAELSMHATAGMTAEYLERALTCHAAGHKEAHPNDPLHPRGRIDEIGVRSIGAGFVVIVMSNDAATANEIWQRSQAFAGESVSVDVRQVPHDEAD